MVARISPAELELNTLLATHSRESYMQEQRSEYGAGGKVGEADQESPVDGQARVTVFDMVYWLSAVEEGVADASWVDKAV